MQGIITSIQRMSVHDGPGIRSTVFLKGCNFRCKWCHNPETFSSKQELEWISEKCINCGECIKVCQSKALDNDGGFVQYNKNKCEFCFQCLDVCYPEALLKIGQYITPEELFSAIEQDFPFFRESNGGVTFSGGEPLLQHEFVRKSLKLFKDANIHTAIETNLSVAWERIEGILPFADLIMTDLKAIDVDVHQYWTGNGSQDILRNIEKLDASGKEYWARTPVIPNVNSSKNEIEAIASFVSKLKNLSKFELLPFHPLANSKYINLGICNPMKETKAVSNAEFDQYYKIFNETLIKLS